MRCGVTDAEAESSVGGVAIADKGSCVAFAASGPGPPLAQDQARARRRSALMPARARRSGDFGCDRPSLLNGLRRWLRTLLVPFGSAGRGLGRLRALRRARPVRWSGMALNQLEGREQEGTVARTHLILEAG